MEPPKEVKEVIEKSIPLIVQGGHQTINRLRLSKPTVFSFFNKGDPHHAYYLEQLEKSTSNQSPQQAKWIPTPPQQYLFSPQQPPLAAKDLDLIKLSALYSAKNKGFIHRLSCETGKDVRFQFLRKQHPLHALFMSYVDQYKLVLEPSEEMKARIEKCKAFPPGHPQNDLMNRAMRRAEFLAYDQKEEPKKDHNEFARIDWQDFEVVATLEYSETELASLPSGITKEEVEYAPLDRKGSLIDELNKPVRYFVSPYTGEKLSEDDFNEHMKVMRLDPKWKEHKEIRRAQRPSNLVSEQVMDNLERIKRRKR